MIERKTIWNEAGRQALPLACISIAYVLITWGLGKLESSSKLVNVLVNVSGVLLWTVKFGACLVVTKNFMQKFCNSNPEADNSDSFRYGFALGFLAALFYSAFYLAYTLFLAPDVFSEALESAMSTYSSFMDANSLSKIEEMIPRMPQISFFVNLLYCTLFGTVLAAIYSSNIPSRNPFKDNSEQ